MRVIFEHDRAALLHGDSKDLGEVLDENSVDAIVCDPPSGIGFMAKGWDKDKGGRDAWIAWLVEVITPAFRALKPGGHALVWALPRTSHWTATALEDAGFEIRDIHLHLFGTGFPKSLNVSKAIDDHVGAVREKLGERLGTGSKTFAGEEGGKGLGPTVAITAPASDEAKRWDGWGTALKPAAEHWILCRKPLIGTVAANVIAHGTGGLNIDACRIGDSKCVPSSASTVGNAVYGTGMGFLFAGTNTSGFDPNVGRWPAHVSFDESAAAVLDEQSGQRTSGAVKHGSKRAASSSSFGDTHGNNMPEIDANKGGASRFFYVAKGARSEKDAGLDHLPKCSGGEATDREVDSAGLNNPRAGAGRTGGARNFHPCLPPGEVVRTIDGWRAIETVRPGDRVMTHDGQFTRVSDAFAKPCDDEVVTIGVDGENRTSTLTTNHPLLIWRPLKKRHSIVGAEVGWQDAGDVRVGDYTMTPRIAASDKAERSEDLWWALGLWLAKGSEHTSGNFGSYPAFSLHQREADLVARLGRVFGAERVRVYPAKESLGVNVVVLVHDVVDEWIAWCGKGALNKHLPMQVWKQDDTRRRALLEGYLAGDGCVIRGMPRAKSASEDLAAGIATLAESVGYYATTYRWDSATGVQQIKDRVVRDNGHAAVYLNDGSAKQHRPQTATHEGVSYTLRRVKSVVRAPYKGPVHNLTVDGPHTFQVRIGMSHNTVKSIELMRWLVRLITPPGGTVLDPFAGSGSTGVAALAEGANFIGCELTNDYLPILVGRIRHALGLSNSEIPAADAA